MVEINKTYDCIIVGAGPAGLFSAIEFVKNSQLNILILEKGQSLGKRICPADKGNIECQSCLTCAKTTGWGGAGAFSDGKLNIAKTNQGVRITDFIDLKDFKRLVTKSDELWLDFGAPQKLYGVDDKEIEKIKTAVKRAKMELKVSPIRHLGTENTIEVLESIYQFLKNKVEIKFNSRVEKILVEDQKIKGVLLENGEKYFAKYVIVAPGREGMTWFTKECQKLNLEQINHPIEIGVRVEVPAKVMKSLTDVLYEAKISHRTETFDNTVRTFCMCPNGYVTMENVDAEGRIKSVNGHSYKNKKSDNTNFALLVKTNFTYPFKEPNLYGTYVAGLANLISGGILVQRLGDLLAGRRSNPERMKSSKVKPTLKSAVPGDLAFVLPYRHLTNLLETLKAMDKVAPGVFSFDTLLYGVEIKFYSSSPKLTNFLETEVENLFACGDGAGVSRNLVHASVSGLFAAEEINRRGVNKMNESENQDTGLVVLGSQWGDEGKGRFVDYLTQKANIVVRFSGGNNAGHTVIYKGKKFLFTILPSGALYGKKLIIASGVGFDPEVLLSEIKAMKKEGVKVDLMIDPRAHIVMPYHRQRDVANEARRGKEGVGSVGFGIGYCFVDRARRGNVRFEDLIDARRLREKLAYFYPINKNTLQKLYSVKIDPEKKIFEQLKKYGVELKKYMGDASQTISQAWKDEKVVLFEGSQGVLLDVNFGTYPYATGSHIIAGHIFSSVGLPPRELKVIGVVKAFNSRAGGGPFPTEISIEKGPGKHILVKGHEYEEFPGVPVRPRRIGWLDLPMLRYAHSLNGFSNLALTHLDTMAGLSEIKVCTHYRQRGKKHLLPSFPGMTDNIQPVYKEVNSWPEIESGKIKKFADLPIQAREYVSLIEAEVGVPVKYVSTGPERDNVVSR